MTIAVGGLFSLRSFAKHIHPREAHALRGSGYLSGASPE